jgi:hypothetical protein
VTDSNSKFFEEVTKGLKTNGEFCHEDCRFLEVSAGCRYDFGFCKLFPDPSDDPEFDLPMTLKHDKKNKYCRCKMCKQYISTLIIVKSTKE